MYIIYTLLMSFYKSINNSSRNRNKDIIKTCKFKPKTYTLKGTVPRDFRVQVFSRISFPQPLSIPLGLFRNCSKICRDIREFSKKIEMTRMLLSGSWGKMIHETNLKQKILWYCPYKRCYRYSERIKDKACNSSPSNILCFFSNMNNSLDRFTIQPQISLSLRV